MKILLLSDLHGHKKTLDKIFALLDKQSFDLAIISGDITNREPFALQYIQKVYELFSSRNIPLYTVHGNNDPPEVINFLNTHNLNLHYKPAYFSGYQLVGIGGWGDELPPYNFSLDQKTIFVTHIPSSLKSTNTIPPATNQPLIHISGHVHSWQRTYKVGNTTIINVPGAAAISKAAVLTLPKISIEFIHLPELGLSLNALL